jgi:hypothetical protein
MLKLNSTEIVADGMTYSELEAAFNLVADADDWKAPIYAFIPVSDFNRCLSAVRFFTATDLVVKGTHQDAKSGVWMMAVHADGYRNGPAGP